MVFVQNLNADIILFIQDLFKSKDYLPRFFVHDLLAKVEVSNKLIVREQNRNFLRVENDFVEVITRDDAKFLYQEGRIKKFALLEPTDAELDDLQNFYKPAVEDILVFRR